MLHCGVRFVLVAVAVAAPETVDVDGGVGTIGDVGTIESAADNSRCAEYVMSFVAAVLHSVNMVLFMSRRNSQAETTQSRRKRAKTSWTWTASMPIT